MPQEFKIQTETNTWNIITIPDGEELAVGTKVYEGERMMLIGGVETMIADVCWGGTYLLENGKSIEVADGIIVEINEIPIAMKDRVAARKKEIKEKLKLKYN